MSSVTVVCATPPGLSAPRPASAWEVLTTLPGVHLYTANFLAPVTAGKDGAHYAARDAVCFETEDFPDAPNHPNFPDTTLLPGKPVQLDDDLPV